MGGGEGLEYWGLAGGANFQQAHDVVTTLMRRNDVTSTSFWHHVPTRFFDKSSPSNSIFVVSPAKQKRDICTAFPASSSSLSSSAA